MENGVIDVSSTKIMDALAAEDFPVASRAVRFYSPNDKLQNCWPKSKSHRAIVRSDTDQVLSVVSDRYKLIPHVESLGPVAERMDAEGWTAKKVHVEGQGGRLHIEAINTSMPITMPDGKDIIPRLILSNSYDGTTAVRFTVGAFRLICTNGMVIAAKGFEGINIRHAIRHSKSGAIEVGAFSDSLGNFTDQFPRVLELFEPLANAEIPEDIAPIIGAHLFGGRGALDMLGRWGNGRGQNGRRDAWNLYNAASEYLTDSGMQVGERERRNGRALELIGKVARKENLGLSRKQYDNAADVLERASQAARKNARRN